MLNYSSTQDLKQTILNTDNFFQSLTRKYGKLYFVHLLLSFDFPIFTIFYFPEITDLTDSTKTLIDREIDRYLKTVLGQLKVSRSKKDLYESKSRGTGN